MGVPSVSVDGYIEICLLLVVADRLGSYAAT